MILKIWLLRGLNPFECQEPKMANRIFRLPRASNPELCIMARSAPAQEAACVSMACSTGRLFEPIQSYTCRMSAKQPNQPILSTYLSYLIPVKRITVNQVSSRNHFKNIVVLTNPLLEINNCLLLPNIVKATPRRTHALLSTSTLIALAHCNPKLSTLKQTYRPQPTNTIHYSQQEHASTSSTLPPQTEPTLLP